MATSSANPVPPPPPHMKAAMGPLNALFAPTEAPPTRKPSRRSRRLASKREALRNTLWPESGQFVWSRQLSPGFTSVPRIVPLVMRLIGDLTPKGDASRVYLDLWCRAFDEGLIVVRDDEEMAFTCGYDGPRALRTWREHIDTLVKLGFILKKELGNRDIGHVLIIDPTISVARLKANGQVPEKWWNMYLTRMNEIGANAPLPAEYDRSNKENAMVAILNTLAPLPQLRGRKPRGQRLLAHDD